MKKWQQIFLFYFFVFAVPPNLVKAQSDSLRLLYGLGMNGFGGRSNVTTGNTFSSGLNNQTGGFLLTMSYSEIKGKLLGTTASLSMQLLFPATDEILFGLGPEIKTTIYGHGISGIGSIHYAVLNKVYLGMFYSGFSKIGIGAMVQF